MFKKFLKNMIGSEIQAEIKETVQAAVGKQCLCGCGQYVKPGNKFINGHSGRVYGGVKHTGIKHPRRKTKETLALEGHAGSTKKQLEQYLGDEDIDLAPKIYRRFEWKDAPVERGERVVQFFKKFLVHASGDWLGKPFQLLEWQEKFLRETFGTLKPDGYRQYHEGYLEIGKKNGKSELCAGIGLFCLVSDDEHRPNIVIASGNIEQANEVFEAAEVMINESEVLRKCIKIISSGRRLVYPSEYGLMKIISSEAETKHGKNLSVVIIDELHVLKDRNLIKVLTTGSGAARKQQLILYLTTAGDDKHVPGYKIHEYALQIKDGIIEDPTFLPVIYSLDPNKDWKDESNWKDANPGLGTILNIEEMRREFKKALRSPAEESDFRQLRLNQWTDKVINWLPIEVWNKNGGSINVDSLKGRTCYGGLDLSSVRDFTSFVLVFPPLNGEKIQILSFHWLPEHRTQERKNDHLINDWAKQGYIFLIEGDVISRKEVIDKIKDIMSVYEVREIAYDRARQGDLYAVDLMELGKEVIPFGQGWISMDPAIKQLEVQLLTASLNHGNNPVLKWMFGNIAVEIDKAGNISFHKGKSQDKIDGIVSLTMALDRAMRNRVDEGGFLSIDM